LTNHANGITRPTSETIDRAVRLLVEAVHPQKIILFGSFARGDETPDSDVDLVVILPSVDNHFSEMVRLRRTLREYACRLTCSCIPMRMCERGDLVRYGAA
jgi:predicted nucleotidyltransferase